MSRLAIELVPHDQMQSLAERAQTAAAKLRLNSFPSHRDLEPSTPDTSMSTHPRALSGFYQFGMIVLANALVSATVNAADGASTRPALSIESIKDLAVIKQLTNEHHEWETPTVEHTWTKRSYRIRKLVKEFSEATHADY